MNTKIIAIISTVISLVGIILLAMGVRNYNNDIKESADAYNEIAMQISSLEAERRTKERAILDLENEIDSVETKATVSLIMCGMSEEIYTTVFPLTEENGIKGTLVLYGDKLPGGEGLLNDSQIMGLVTAGWNIIPGWTESDGENGITASCQWIKDYGYDSKETVFISEENCTDERLAALTAEGFTTVIIDASIGSADKIFSDTVGDIWYPPSMGYKTPGNKTILEEALSVNGNIFFTIGFEEEDELYNETSFKSMLSYLKSKETDESLYISDIPSVKAYRTDMDARVSEAVSSTSLKIEEYKKSIEDIDAKIKELCDTFSG